MRADRNAASIHGTFEADRLDSLTRYALDALDVYARTLLSARPVVETARLAEVERFHARFRDDIRTRDRAQGMTARFIGKERARKIFHEVAS